MCPDFDEPTSEPETADAVETVEDLEADEEEGKEVSGGGKVSLNDFH